MDSDEFMKNLCVLAARAARSNDTNLQLAAVVLLTLHATMHEGAVPQFARMANEYYENMLERADRDSDQI